MRTHPFLKRLCLALFAGGLCALSMPPYGIMPALVGGLSLFYVLLNALPRTHHGFFLGWAFGFGYFLAGISWVGDALLVGGNPWRWAWPLAVVALPASLALYPATIAAIHIRWRPRAPVAAFLQFAALMSLEEWLRGHLFTGFPWNLYGYGWGGASPVSQTASLWGIYGLTLLTLIWGSLPGYLWISHKGGRSERHDSYWIAGSGLLLLTLCYGFGLWRLRTHPPVLRPETEIVLVQPSIPQSEKWTSGKMVQHFEKYLALSRPNASTQSRPSTILPQTTLIVWPETALVWPILEADEGIRALQATLQAWPNPAFLASGTLLRTTHPNGKTGYRNAVALIDRNGGLPWIHDKAHLVPFGEYIPFQDWIPLAPVTGFSGFEAGSGPDTLPVDAHLTVSPLICYEIIFPGAGLRADKPRPDVLLNVTNDGWYGESAGPYQHFEQALFRAIESGLPVIRSANTGISAVIAPTGQPVARISLMETGAVRTLLPAPLPPPPYIRFGETLYFLFTGLLFLARMRQKTGP